MKNNIMNIPFKGFSNIPLFSNTSPIQKDNQKIAMIAQQPPNNIKNTILLIIYHF